MKKIKVLYLVNFAPNYRESFLRELGKFVDLTVTSYVGLEANLVDPQERLGYKYIPLKRYRVFGFNLNIKEYLLGAKDFDVIIVGYTLWNPFRMFNLLRLHSRVICEGLIYGRSNSFFTKLLRNFFISRSEGVLVYSDSIKHRLTQETSKPVLSFNNTSYSKNEIVPKCMSPFNGKLNILWVGRYQRRKKIERLYDLAKNDPRVYIRVIGPGTQEAFAVYPVLDNFEVIDAVYDSGLDDYFEWSHVVFNPGHAGLLVMNAARCGRAIVIDKYSHHAGEIQLAIEANQDFIDFSDKKIVQQYIDGILAEPDYLRLKGKEIAAHMERYTIEYMSSIYLKAIKGQWN